MSEVLRILCLSRDRTVGPMFAALLDSALKEAGVKSSVMRVDPSGLIVDSRVRWAMGKLDLPPYTTEKLEDIVPNIDLVLCLDEESHRQLHQTAKEGSIKTSDPSIDIPRLHGQNQKAYDRLFRRLKKMMPEVVRLIQENEQRRRVA